MLRKIILKPGGGPLVTVVESVVYERTFDRAEQPWEVDEKEWAILRRTGLFEELSEPEQAGTFE